MSIFRHYPTQRLPAPKFTPGTTLDSPVGEPRVSAAAYARSNRAPILIATGIAALIPVAAFVPASQVPQPARGTYPVQAPVAAELAPFLSPSSPSSPLPAPPLQATYQRAPWFVQEPSAGVAALIPVSSAVFSASTVAVWPSLPAQPQQPATKIAATLNSPSSPSFPLPTPPLSQAAYQRAAWSVQEPSPGIAALIPVESFVFGSAVQTTYQRPAPAPQILALGSAALIPPPSSYVPLSPIQQPQRLSYPGQVPATSIAAFLLPSGPIPRSVDLGAAYVRVYTQTQRQPSLIAATLPVAASTYVPPPASVQQPPRMHYATQRPALSVFIGTSLSIIGHRSSTIEVYRVSADGSEIQRLNAEASQILVVRGSGSEVGRMSAEGAEIYAKRGDGESGNG